MDTSNSNMQKAVWGLRSLRSSLVVWGIQVRYRSFGLKKRKEKRGGGEEKGKREQERKEEKLVPKWWWEGREMAAIFVLLFTT